MEQSETDYYLPPPLNDFVLFFVFNNIGRSYFDGPSPFVLNGFWCICEMCVNLCVHVC